MNTTEYENAAAETAARLGIRVEILPGDGRCPPWSGGGSPRLRSVCPECGDIHGEHYRIRLTEHGGKVRPFESDYWHRYADSAKGRREAEAVKLGLTPGTVAYQEAVNNPGWRHPKALPPSVYDVLCCIVGDTSIPEEADDVAAEYGDNMKPSRAEDMAKAGRRVRRFFSFLTTEQMDELIQVCQ